MDQRIENLETTTFFGRRFTRREIIDIQETVARFPALSRHELTQTVCEHLNWHTRRLPDIGLQAHTGASGGMRHPDPAGDPGHGRRPAGSH